jgi:ABC-2 type transport system permease protein
MSAVNLRQIWAFFVVSFKSNLRSSSSIILGLAFPLVFMVIFGFISLNTNVQPRVGVVRQSSESYKIVKEVLALSLSDGTGLEIWESDSFYDLKDRLERNQLEAIVTVNNDTELTLYLNKSKTAQSDYVKQALNASMLKYSLLKSEQKPIFEIKNQDLNARSNRYIDFALPGLLGFSIISAAITGTAYSYISLRKTNALKRIFAGPAKPENFIIGQAISRLVFSFIQNLLLIIVAMTLFSFMPRFGFASTAQMLVVIMLGIFAFLGLGYIVAGVSKNEDQATPFAQLLILPQILLAGTFFPVDSLPQGLQYFAKALPLYSFNEALRLISLDGKNLWSSDVSLLLLALIAWIVVIYFVASKVFKVKE